MKQRKPMAASDKLLALAVEISQKHPRNFERQLEVFWQSVGGDPELLMELLTPLIKRDIARTWLNKAASHIRELTGVGFVRDPGGKSPTPVKPLAVKNPPVTPPRSLYGGNGIRLIEEAAKKSLLDTFPVNGKPVGDVTVRELRGWVFSNRRDARFVELLITGLPEDGIPRDYHRPSDVEKLYKLAEIDHAT